MPEPSPGRRLCCIYMLSALRADPHSLYGCAPVRTCYPGARATHISFEVAAPVKHPVSVTADCAEVRDVKEVSVWEDTTVDLRPRFEPEHALAARIVKEQFIV